MLTKGGVIPHRIKSKLRAKRQASLLCATLLPFGRDLT